MKSRAFVLLVAGLIVSLVLLVGCDGEIGNGITTTEDISQTTTTGEDRETTTTEAPETTTTGAPDTTPTSGETETTAAPETEDETSTTRQYVLIGILALAFIVIVIVAISVSLRGKKAEATSAVPAWRATAEQAYSQSRWLYENLTPDIAQWRGDWLHRTGEQPGGRASDSASAREQTWNQLGTQMTVAVTTLYNLEVQVDPASQPLVRSLIDSLNHTRTAVDQAASARLAVNRATDAFRDDSGNQRLQQDLAAAHAHENQSVQNLKGIRTVLHGALTDLAALK